MKRKPAPKKAKSLRRQMKEVAAQKSKKKRAPEKSRATVSTGSTTLDLALTGTAIPGGGLWGGIVVEFFGQNSSGKTTIMSEVAGNAQRAGGEVYIDDPEARLVSTYCKRMGVTVSRNLIRRPDTVQEIFDFIIGPHKSVKGKKKRDFSKGWRPNPKYVNVLGEDSIAALSTHMELEAEDKRGQDKPRQFSQGFRQSMRIIRKHNILLFLTNQVRDSMALYGEKTKPTGGHALGFYTSIRVRLSDPKKLFKEIVVNKKKVRRYYGVETEAFVYKSNLDIPFRSAKLFIIFDYGIDDIRGNLWWLKEHGFGYKLNGKKLGNGLNAAIEYVEKHNLERELRKEVQREWLKLEKQLTAKRKPKERF